MLEFNMLRMKLARALGEEDWEAAATAEYEMMKWLILAQDAGKVDNPGYYYHVMKNVFAIEFPRYRS